MNCPNCKNPIENSANVCEWCGYEIVKKEEKYDIDGCMVKGLVVLAIIVMVVGVIVGIVNGSM